MKTYIVTGLFDGVAFCLLVGDGIARVARQDATDYADTRHGMAIEPSYWRVRVMKRGTAAGVIADASQQFGW